MNRLTLLITFHTPFRVATGAAGSAVDEVIDRAVPLPGSSLKGLMRDAARLLLPRIRSNGARAMQDHDLVQAVFGDRHRQSPWHWDDAVVDSDVQVAQRARIRLTQERTTEPGALLVAEEAEAHTATALIWQSGAVPDDLMPVHLALLGWSARLVEAVGADRRRGLGWVGVAGPDVGRDELDLIWKHRKPEAPQ